MKCKFGLGKDVHLTRLVHSFLWICLDFVAGMVGNLGNRLLKDGGCLSDWK